MELGAQDENRTRDLRITSALEANECSLPAALQLDY